MSICAPWRQFPFLPLVGGKEMHRAEAEDGHRGIEVCIWEIALMKRTKGLALGTLGVVCSGWEA